MSDPVTVLLVEDDPELRDTIELLLLGRGYHVVSTGDGLRAAELGSQHRVHAALVDVLLPGQSGFQVTTALKALYGDAVQVVMMSGNASPAHRDYALASGAARFLAKPFHTAQLMEALAAVCPPPPTGAKPAARVRIGS